MSADQIRPAFAAMAGSIQFGDQLARLLETTPGARVLAPDFGKLVGEMVHEATADVLDAFRAQVHQGVDLQLAAMSDRMMIKSGAVTGTGVFKAAAVVRDSSAKPRHRRQHSVVVHFTDGEPEVYHVKGVAWRIAKRAIAQHVRRQRDVVRVSFVMQPVQPVERITFKSTVGEVLP